MKTAQAAVIWITLCIAAHGIIVRHDVAEPETREFALRYVNRGVVHLDLPDGEGTLIASMWVATAAHLAGDIRVGADVRAGGGKYRVREVMVHPEYRNNRRHDLALLRLDRPVEGMQPVPMYAGHDELGKRIVIVGRGDFGTGQTGPQAKTDGPVRAGTNRVEQVTDLDIRFDFDQPGSDRSTELESVSGPGDSGGPAFIESGSGDLALVGVSSSQMRNGREREGLYGVTERYVRVSAYRDWICKTMAAHAETTVCGAQ